MQHCSIKYYIPITISLTTVHMHMQKTQADSITRATPLFRYERLLIPWLLSSVLLHKVRETRFLNVFRIILCLQNSNSRQIPYSFRYPFNFTGRNLKNLTVCLNARNPNFSTPWSERNFYCLHGLSQLSNSRLYGREFNSLCPKGETKSSVLHGPMSTPNSRLHSRELSSLCPKAETKSSV